MKTLESETYKYRVVKHTQRNGNVYYHIQYKSKGIWFWIPWRTHYTGCLNDILTVGIALEKISELIQNDDNIYQNRVISTSIL